MENTMNEDRFTSQNAWYHFVLDDVVDGPAALQHFRQDRLGDLTRNRPFVYFLEHLREL